MKHKKIWVIFGALAFLAMGCSKNTTNIIPQAQQQPSTSLTQQPLVIATPSGKKPQFVVMAFDGSRSFTMWENTLNFSEQMTARGYPVHFTYFLSGVYFLNWHKASSYHPPLKSAGTSLIGFADSNLDIEKRVVYVNRAIADGNEIGSHANGHFDGSLWTYKDWQQELDEFNKLIFSIPQNNDVSPEDAGRYTINLRPEQVVGFRAPELGNNQNLYSALSDQSYKYDTSKAASKPSDWPAKLPNGLWEFPLAKIQYATTTSSLLSMDYNFYFKQSGAKDVAKKGDALWQTFYNDTYTSYINYFNSNYDNDRAPVFIGSHFSEWNDGVYWEAMRDFAQEVCSKPEVRCVTFSELMQYMEQDQK
jgi:hypothetical protein